jgi:GAF domain-containing protein
VSHVDAISIPVKSNTKQVAVIDFYPKKSGDSYTEKDIQLMNTFAKQAAVALDKAKLYTEVKEYAETLE